MEAPQGVELTGTNGGKAIILHHPGPGWWPVLRPSDDSPRQGASGMRHKTLFASIVRFPDRHGPIPPGSFRGRSTRFAAAMARVRRPVPFRTRKLRPCTAMVLHPRGCGRVARRRFQCWGFPSSVKLREPFFVLPACRLEPGPRGFRANGQRKLLDFSPRVSHMSKRLDWSYGKSYGV